MKILKKNDNFKFPKILKISIWDLKYPLLWSIVHLFLDVSELTTDKKTVSTVWDTSSKAKKTKRPENEASIAKVEHHGDKYQLRNKINFRCETERRIEVFQRAMRMR